MLWDMNTGQLKATLRLGSSVHSVSFSPDGSILASGGDDNTVHAVGYEYWPTQGNT